jgi:hypothetical protein
VLLMQDNRISCLSGLHHGCQFVYYFYNIGMAAVFLILTCVLCIFFSFGQRDARRQRGSIDIKSNIAYDMEDIVMPLHEYINDPAAHDIIHNGATFQVFQPMVL